MGEKRIDHLQPGAPRHEGGDPASLQQDPAQAYPTGGAGLIPEERAHPREVGKAPPGPPDEKTARK
ncbi:MAG TPA: hypothetical protein VJ739_17100 [Gemmataceae bacterium]|nr:hypothetical protein [Gemmataceae bacterium]